MAGIIDYDSYLMFNPEGRIKQLEYIKKTTELGNTCLALCNGKSGVLIAHVPRRSKLAEPQDKIFRIGDNALFSFSGITNDGLGMVEYLKNHELFENVIKDREIDCIEVFNDLRMDAAYRTLSGSSRLFGAAGILMISERQRVRVVEFEPQGEVFECTAASIGFRSQSCKTVLEDNAHIITDSSIEELIKIGIKSLSNAHPDPEDNSLKAEDVYISIIEVGKEYRTVNASDYML